MLSGRPQREGSLKAFIHSTAGGTLMNVASFLQLTAPAEHFLCGCCHVHSQVDSGTTRELGRESGFVHLRFQQLFHLSSASRRYLCFQHTSRYWPIYQHKHTPARAWRIKARRSCSSRLSVCLSVPEGAGINQLMAFPAFNARPLKCSGGAEPQQFVLLGFLSLLTAGWSWTGTGEVCDV